MINNMARSEYEKQGLVVSPELNFKGMPYGRWVATWSNWLFSEDADRNEADGHMLFLRGNTEYGYRVQEKLIPDDNTGQYDTSFYNRTGDRCVVIPRGKAIFIPVLTATIFMGSQYEGKIVSSEDQIRLAAQTETGKSSGVWAFIQRIDKGGPLGVWEPIVNDLLLYRTVSPLFTIKISEKSLFLKELTLEDNIGAGEYQAITEGFFILLRSLPSESCRLQFGGKGRALNYITNAIYDIHITDDSRSQVLVRDVTDSILKGDPNRNLVDPNYLKIGDSESSMPRLSKLPR